MTHGETGELLVDAARTGDAERIGAFWDLVYLYRFGIPDRLRDLLTNLNKPQPDPSPQPSVVAALGDRDARRAAAIRTYERAKQQLAVLSRRSASSREPRRIGRRG